MNRDKQVAALKNYLGKSASYKCHECKSLHCTDNVAAFCASCFHAKVSARLEVQKEDNRHLVDQVNQALASIGPLVEALDMLYQETADYIKINNLGGVHDTTSMVMARDALTTPGAQAYIREKKNG